MKPVFFKSNRRLGTRSLLLLLTLCPFAGMAADSSYNNSGSINNANLPQVDATNFVNSGTWNISVSPYYETSDTLHYTNTGTMTGSPGWNFDFNPSPTGQRGMSANLLNDNNGTIQASDGIIFNPNIPFIPFRASYLLISATNIVNK